ncbi:diacylglycerol kinase family protein [Butyricicoccus faecihominis]|uniref:diacylglycerol kinase family protein n=1 Tax=Butyricicoccaceae TaxID=3085642 RepID=UPI002479D47F|nr:MULTISPECIES: diacylglycerol kinase family protein [Butyricicoccaceae]MCQ5129801.1 diacylglycerol kinase family protein [Butyricicoccus faecihominis]WNX83755.1 diacylglycerol kinase family protein [Agathobaculum sp. NTUH-O15-33]
MKKEIRKLHESFLNAFRGLALCIHSERNFRVHMVAALYVTLFALIGRATTAEGAILCICFGLTMGAELMNTAIERLCDKQTSGYDQMVRNAKDIAAAAVFVCAAACAIIGLVLFLGEGLLSEALAYLGARPWAAGAVVVSVPFALLFIFKYGRIQ